MKITDVKARPVTAIWDRDPFFPKNRYASVLIEVHTDEGVVGYGETTLGYFAPRVAESLVDFYRPVLLGGDPLDHEILTREMRNVSVWWARAGAGPSVISGIEIALWDLKGKILGQPVCRLLGGVCREQVPVYASGGPSYWPLEKNLEKMTVYRDMGYRAAKVSTSFYDPGENEEGGAPTRLTTVPMPYPKRVEMVRESIEMLRKHMGDGFDLAIDGHQGGVPEPESVEEAAQIARAVSPYRLRFFEEPLSYNDVEGYARLSALNLMPIAGGESLVGVEQFRPFITQGAVNLVQPDLGFVGGIAETIRVLDLAHAFGIRAALHTGAAFGPVFAASWHVAAAHPAVEWLECVTAASGVQNDMVAHPVDPRDGTIGVPTQPGLSLSIGEEHYEKYAFVEGSGELT